MSTYHTSRHAEYGMETCPVCQAQERAERVEAELAHYKATGLLPEEVEQLQADHDSWRRMQKQDEIELARHHIEAHANAGCQYCRALAEPQPEALWPGEGPVECRHPPSMTCSICEPQPQERHDG